MGNMTIIQWMFRCPISRQTPVSCVKPLQAGFMKIFARCLEKSRTPQSLVGGFGTCFIFPNNWDDDPIWLIFFRGLKPPMRSCLKMFCRGFESYDLAWLAVCFNDPMTLISATGRDDQNPVAWDSPRHAFWVVCLYANYIAIVHDISVNPTVLLVRCTNLAIIDPNHHFWLGLITMFLRDGAPQWCLWV